MKILFLAPYAPTPVRTRSHNFIRTLARQGHTVVLATVFESDAEGRALAGLRSAGVEVVARSLPRARSAYELIRALASADPLQSRFSWQPALARTLAALASAADVVHIEHVRGGRYGLSLQRALAGSAQPPIVWDSVDCISHLFEQAAKNRRGWIGKVITAIELPRTRRYEARLARAFDRVVVTSPNDRDALARLAPDRREVMRVVPNGVDLHEFAPGPADGCDPDTVVFTGKMSYHANVAAADFLVKRVMPLVWERYPRARLVIAGSRPPRSLLALAAASSGRVTVTGAVPRMSDVLRQAGVAVAPMQYGAGIQNKVLEAMACGVPVVASPLAVSALEHVPPGRDCLVGESAEELARAVTALFESERHRDAVGQAGRAYVEAHHDWDAAARALVGVYREVMSE